MAKKPSYKSTPVETNRTSMMPEGIHTLRVIDFKENMGGSGYPYWGYTCEVDEGSPWDGSAVWHNVSLSPQSRFKMDEWLDSFGIPEGKKIHGEELLGKHFRAKIVHDTYEGRKKASIDTTLPEAAPKKKTAKRKPKPKVKVEGITATEDTDDVVTDKGLPEDSIPQTSGAKKRPF